MRRHKLRWRGNLKRDEGKVVINWRTRDNVRRLGDGEKWERGQENKKCDPQYERGLEEKEDIKYYSKCAI